MFCDVGQKVTNSHKMTGVKRDQAKRERPNQKGPGIRDQAKRDQPKRDHAKRDQPKRDHSKRDQPKRDHSLG